MWKACLAFHDHEITAKLLYKFFVAHVAWPHDPAHFLPYILACGGL